MTRLGGLGNLVGTQDTTPSGYACRVQTRCNRPSVFVLGISPPKEGNNLPLLYSQSVVLKLNFDDIISGVVAFE